MESEPAASVHGSRPAQPATLQSPTVSMPIVAPVVITGVEIPFGEMVGFFVRAWCAWLVAALVIAVILLIPTMIVGAILAAMDHNH